MVPEGYEFCIFLLASHGRKIWRLASSEQRSSMAAKLLSTVWISPDRHGWTLLRPRCATSTYNSYATGCMTRCCCHLRALPSRELCGLTLEGPDRCEATSTRGATRSSQQPSERDKAILGTLFADLAWEVALLVAQGAAAVLAFEQPEDLGALKKGPHRGQRPASTWQWPQLHQALEKGLCTVAFHQSSFGVPFPKPTRLLLKYTGPRPNFVFEGRPTFADDGSYVGPLPAPSEHRPTAMAGRDLGEHLFGYGSAYDFVWEATGAGQEGGGGR